MGIPHIRCREIMYQLWGNHVITFTGKLNLICKKKPTIFMGIPHIRCREIMYQLWGNHVITFTGKLNLICKKKPTIFVGKVSK